MEPVSDSPSFVREPDVIAILTTAVASLQRIATAIDAPASAHEATLVAATGETVREVARAVAWQIECLNEYLEALGGTAVGASPVALVPAEGLPVSQTLHARRMALDALTATYALLGVEAQQCGDRGTVLIARQGAAELAPLIQRLGDHVPDFVAAEFFASVSGAVQPTDGVV